MAKICKVCQQSYSDELGACPHCSSAIEIVLGDTPKSGDSAKKPKPVTPRRVEGNSDSDIEIDLGKLPPPAAGDSPSAASNVKWAALVDKPSESGVDLTAGGLVVDSPSDAALLRQEPAGPARGTQTGSWVDIGVTPPKDVDDGSGIVIAAGGGKPGAIPLGPGSGSDDDIDLARLEAEARARPGDGSGLVLEGGTPPRGTRPPRTGSDSESEIDLGALMAGAEGDTSARFAEHLLLDKGSDVDFGQPPKPSSETPSGLDLVAEALDSGVDLAGTGKKAVTVSGDSDVDLAALFEDEPPAGKKGKQRPADTSAVDLGALLPLSDDPLARALRTPTSSDVRLAERGDSEVQLGGDARLAGGSDVRLADSGRLLGESDVQLAAGSGRRRGREVPLAAPVGIMGTGDPKEDSRLALSDEPRMEDDELVPPRPTVPAERASGRGGAWVGGGILGALLGTAACVGVWFSGVLSSDPPPPRPAQPGQASVEVARLKEEVQRLKSFETDAQQKGELLTKYEEATENWKDQVTKLQDKLKTAAGGGEAMKTAQAAQLKAEADRKLAQDQADKARQQATLLTKQVEEATTREVTLKKELDEAKKAADPKALELFKKDREAVLVKLKDAESKLADAEKSRKEAETKAADLAKAKKDADVKVADAEKARQSADQKVADLMLALKEAKGGKPDTAMAKLLEGARTEAADAKKRLDEALKKFTDAEKVADTARVEAEKAKKDATAAVKAATVARLKAEKTVEILTRQLAEARATPGGAKTIFPREAVDAMEAEEQYAGGVRSYHDGDFAQAERSFVEAGRHGGQDARYHYYLGLTRLAQGKSDTAVADFREAARLERQSKPSRATVNTALERIQGTARQTLERYR